MIDDSTCEQCQRDMESVLHVLWECSVAVDVWVGSMKRILNHGGGQDGFLQLLEVLIHRLPLEEVEMFLVQAWMLWILRNKVRTRGAIQDPAQLVQWASIFLKEYKASQDHHTVPNMMERSSRWVLPPENRFKVNFDVAVFQEIHALGFKTII